jgi:type IV secretion system protein VirB4
MDDALTVLSGSVDNVALLDEIRARVGDDPSAWMPELFQAVQSRKASQRRTR